MSLPNLRFLPAMGMVVGLFTPLMRLPAQENWRVETVGAWTVKGEIKEHLDVSGASMMGRDAVLVSDETRVLQRIHLDQKARQISAAELLPLLPGKKPELDLEGVTSSAEEKVWFATGSHSVARKTGEVQTDRRGVYRITKDGRRVTSASLVRLVESDEVLRDSLGKATNQGGLDIEGIAKRGEFLWFGLRAPNVAGQACVIQVGARELFTDESRAAHRRHLLALGEGFGIRDITATQDGFLLIAGPSGTDESAEGFSLYFWAGPDGSLIRVGDIPVQNTGKAEALLVLDETVLEISVLVFFDGAPDGAPLELKLIKPARAAGDK